MDGHSRSWRIARGGGSDHRGCVGKDLDSNISFSNIAVLKTSDLKELNVKSQISALLFAVIVPLVVTVGNADAAGRSAAAQNEAKTETSAPFVTVPPSYVYKPDAGSLHDYCTSSPDKFPNPFGRDADFRGPCARHDLCLEGKTVPASTCNARLRTDLITNCKRTYGRWNPIRIDCIETAFVYFAAVTAANP
jgi:hypothetical protein